jgi:hypothetical protein
LAALLCAATGAAWAPGALAQQQPTPQPLSAVQLTDGNAAIENPASLPGKAVLSAADEAFLDDLERRGIQYFVDEADSQTGLMPDRAKAIGGTSAPASIASVGFGLTALCIGDQRGWVPHQEAYDRSLRVLNFIHDHLEQHHGYFYHFLDMHTGQRTWNCEVSDIDTALLMAGVLTVRQHFSGTELASVADGLYQRVDWGWLQAPDGALYMGWSPEHGFIRGEWKSFSEGPPLIYLLGMGSKSHPLSPQTWRSWQRQPLITYAGLTFMKCPPLFTHQYPQCWFDLRGLRDDYAEYYRDSQLATLAQRQWCMDDLSKRFSTYGPNMWGLTASDSEQGYTAWGGPPVQGEIDGSVVPCAAAGSLAFEPRLCLDALETMRRHCGEKGYLKYGFVDAFNPANGWYNPDVLGIDLGPSILMAENCRSGFVWKTFMSSPEITAALKAGGFRPLDPADQVPATTSVFSTGSSESNAGQSRVMEDFKSDSIPFWQHALTGRQSRVIVYTEPATLRS